MADSCSLVDTRDSELQQVHSRLAKEAYLAHLTAVQERLASMAAAGPQYQYNVKLGWGGLLFAVLTIDFSGASSSTFTGYAGGLVVGGGASWGTAWLNVPLTSLKGASARFQATFLAAATNVNLWAMDGSFIGTIASGGIPAGSGVVGGQGSFS